MNNLLIFFAFPVAIIILSIILQKLLNSPSLIAALAFAIFLVITFTAFDETFLIAVLAYTVLAFITALITKLLCRYNQENNNSICNLSNNSNVESARNDTNNCFNYTYNRYKSF